MLNSPFLFLELRVDFIFHPCDVGFSDEINFFAKASSSSLRRAHIGNEIAFVPIFAARSLLMSKEMRE